jgi:predicted PurR-regulated permease PerM
MRDPIPTIPRVAAKVDPVGSVDTPALLMLAVFVVVVTGLYFAREVMVPITLAVLLSFVLAPLVNLLRLIHLPRVAAVLLSVVLALGVIVALAGLIGMQLASLARDFPRYQYTFERKSAVVQHFTSGWATDLTNRFGHSVQLATPPASSAPSAPKPTPVQVEPPPLSPIAIAREFLAPVVAPLSDGAIMFVVAIFVLLQQDDLRDRLIRLFGSSDLHRTTVAMDDAGRRLSRYFLTQLAINAAFGCVIGGGLAIIGVPSPLLWGVFGTLLRFVPYIGSLLAALLPLALASVVDPGWSMALWTVALFLIVELITGQAIEPLLYGHSTGLSPLSVVVAAIFWSWLWGPIGLILSTPLTLCLVVLGRHIPRLEFLDVVLGDRPALTPAESLYQRILAGDGDEALDQAEQILRDRSLSSYYDEVVLPALRLAAVDFDRDLLPPEHVEKVVATVQDLVADLDSYDDVDPPGENATDGPVAPPDRERELPKQPAPGPDFVVATACSPWDSPTPVLCVAGRGPMDDAAAAMLTQLLTKHGLGARTASHAALARDRMTELAAETTAMVCICYVEVGGSATHLRYLLRRLRLHLSSATVLVGLWPQGEAAPDAERMRIVIGADHISDSLTATVNACLRAAEARSSSREEERLSA